MKPFMDENFLLETETARTLFHEYAAPAPIIDYHCHLSAQDIEENKPARSLTELWLGDDHYKWRIMRANGEPERLITGDGSDYDKFLAYARTLQNAPGNPLYHWSHLELQRYFGVTTPLSVKTAPQIWAQVSRVIEKGECTPRNLIAQSHVYALCTTEGPCADLRAHERLAADASFAARVLPAFRPDAFIDVGGAHWRDLMRLLGGWAGTQITGMAELKQVLGRSLDDFAAHGCVASDHGMTHFPHCTATESEAEAIVARALRGESVTRQEGDGAMMQLLLWLGQEYHRRGWAMELHIGGLRRVNRQGQGNGYDSVADAPLADALGDWMNRLEARRALPKTILFCLNEKDSIVMATMAGNFQDGEVPGKIQLGTSWWFQDHRDGMEAQMHMFANQGVLGQFIGMLTDSRSFLSYSRHEYFRRIFCNVLGNWVENGEYPADMDTLGALVRNVSFDNARRYFGL